MKGFLTIPVCLLLAACSTTKPDQKPPVEVTTNHESSVVVVSEKPVTPRSLTIEGRSASIIKLKLEGETLIPPNNPRLLGWWGSKIGAEGTTLLVGHTVRAGGGFLDDLEKVPVGSSMAVSGHFYRVTSNRVLSKEKVAQIAPKLFRRDGKNRLVVVTCEDYNPKTGHYDSNVVVVAE